MSDVVLDVYVDAPLIQMDPITSALQALLVAPAGGPHLSFHSTNMLAARSKFELAPRPALESTRQLAPRSVARPNVQLAPLPIPQAEPETALHTAPRSSLQSPPPLPLPSESRPGKTSPPSQSALVSAQPKSVDKPSRKTTAVDEEDEESSFIILQSNSPPAVTGITTGNTQPIVNNSANAKPSGGTPSQDKLHLSAKEITKAGTDDDTDTLISAKAGDVHAQLKLAEAYRDGKGGYRQSYQEAKDLFFLAAQQGDSTAQYNIGLFYEEGRGFVKDSSKATWYDKAAHNGLATAQSNLGILYINGDGVEKNNALPIQWLFTAAKQGNASSSWLHVL